MGELSMYREEDLQDCVKIYYEAFTAEPLCFSHLTLEQSERYLRDITKKPGFLGYVYRDGGEIAAFCFGVLDGYFEGVIFNLDEFAVSPALQRGGLGSKIMAELESRLSMYNVAAVTLHTSRDMPAFGFYEKNAYEVMPQDVTMMKWLRT